MLYRAFALTLLVITTQSMYGHFLSHHKQPQFVEVRDGNGATKLWRELSRLNNYFPKNNKSAWNTLQGIEQELNHRANPLLSPGQHESSGFELWKNCYGRLKQSEQLSLKTKVLAFKTNIKMKHNAAEYTKRNRAQGHKASA